MRKRMRVYICDVCGAIGSEQKYFFYTGMRKGPPEDWGHIGSMDLCPVCNKIFKKMEIEVRKLKGERQC